MSRSTTEKINAFLADLIVLYKFAEKLLIKNV